MAAASRRETLLDKARKLKRESRYIDFKERFDPASDGEWIELIKDFAAMANSGGGAIVIGVKDNGQVSGEDLSAVLKIDPAVMGDKVHSYTGEHFADFEIHPTTRSGKQIAVIEVGPAVDAPLAFIKPGTYVPAGRDKPKFAFREGTVYFRHGAKSQPGNATDFRHFIERRLDEVRERWLGGIRRVVEAPAGTQVAVLQETAHDPEGQPTEIRLTQDPRAPTFGMLDPGDTHPYRRTEVIEEVNKRLPKSKQINGHDIVCVRLAHGISADTHPDFMYDPPWGGSALYSEAFVDWLVEQYKKDKSFFDTARQTYYDHIHG
jgi:hypothetical protein